MEKATLNPYGAALLATAQVEPLILRLPFLFQDAVLPTIVLGHTRTRIPNAPLKLAVLPLTGCLTVLGSDPRRRSGTVAGCPGSRLGRRLEHWCVTCTLGANMRLGVC